MAMEIPHKIHKPLKCSRRKPGARYRNPALLRRRPALARRRGGSPSHHTRGWNQKIASTNIWNAAARLSRRRTCQSSCAITACNCASSRRSEMPSGQTRIGVVIPKIPGSRVERDNRISIRVVSRTECSSPRRASISRPWQAGLPCYTCQRFGTSAHTSVRVRPESRKAKRPSRWTEASAVGRRKARRLVAGRAWVIA